MLNKRFVITGLCVALGAAAVTMGALQVYSYLTAKPGGAPALVGSLEGFEPGAKVSYSVLPEKGKPVGGEAIIDAKGKLDLPGFDLRGAAGRYLSYNVQVNESKKPVDVVLTFDAREGEIAVQGQGLNKFSDVEFSGVDTEELLTKTDWAGIIRNKAAGKLNDLGLKDGFRVAFYDGNIASDADNNSHPKIIKVLAAPGGGMWTPPSGADPQLNQYIEDFYACDDGESPTVEYSFCDTGPMDDQIELIVENYVTALYMMGEQLTAVMGFMMMPVGALIDAKIQLEAQREMQLLVAEAHKDYHPSELMCEFGSYMKSITTSEEKAQYEKLALNDILMNFYTGTEHVSSSESFTSDVDSRVQQFRTVYCDPNDNNNGLRYMCDHDQTGPGNAVGAAQRARINKDIDYNRTMERALTLDIDFAYAHTGGNNRNATADEEDVIALAKNLYWPRVLPPGDPPDLNKNFARYMNVRQLYVMSNIAHNSYVTLAGMKSRTEPGIGVQSGWSYMKAMMRNFGLTDAEIDAQLGDFPSYYAQMEVLTKKIYQHPDFYTNLYDKPANVKRISATLEAIQIMQDRDFYESALRREMLTSSMVEEALFKHIDKINAAVVSDVKNLQRR